MRQLSALVRLVLEAGRSLAPDYVHGKQFFTVSPNCFERTYPLCRSHDIDPGHAWQLILRYNAEG